MSYAKLYYRLHSAFRASLRYSRAAVIVSAVVGLSMGITLGAGPLATPSAPSSKHEGHESKRMLPTRALRSTLLTRWCTTPSGYQAITPCSGTASAPTGASGSFDFTITNTDPVNDVGYNKAVSCTGVSVTCSASGSGYVASDGGTTVITVNWTAPASTGTLYATLLMKPNSGTSDTLQATAAITIYTPPTYTVSVTPDGSDVTMSQPIDTTYQFRVSDNGNTDATYALSVSCPGLTCSVPSTVSVTHGSYSMVTVSLNSGSPGTTGTVTLSASATGTSDNGSMNVVPVTHSVSVTPVGTAINVRAAADTTAPFTVTLTGTASSVTYGLVVSCTEPVYDCTGPGTVAVTNGTPSGVTVSYKTRSDLHGGAGSLTLKATSVYGTTYQSTGSYNITVPNTTDLYTVSVASRTTTIARDKCLAVSAGIGAAYECGDLRLVHALPSVRTMAKERTPVLLYSSQTAHTATSVAPYVAANVFLQSFATTPTALTGKLSINGGTPCNDSWTTSGWTAGTARRIVATCGDVSLATGVYPYSLALTATFTGGGTMNDTLSGSLIVVNRSASPFGAGWWLAGLEQICFPSDGTTRLWVGGDGSARVYRQRGSSNAFYADSVDRPDSLTYDSGTSTYTRWAPHGLKVLFNSSGQHTSTVNRLGQTTSFTYSSGLLQTITVPPSSAGLTYTFTYTSSKLTGVSAPGTPSGSRSVGITQSSGRIGTITDPDGSTVSFGYSGSDTRVASRTDKLGHATAYGYGTAGGGALGTLDSVSVAMDTSTAAIVTTFDAAEVKGMTGGSVVDTSLVYTTINGPRRDTTVTKVWVDGYGAPKKIVDALNDTTKITHGDTRWPALVTRVVDASGFVTAASYDSRGNIASDTSVSPLGGSFGNAINTYSYDGAYDFATRIVGPTGEVWRGSIDGSTGNRTSEALTDTGSVHSTSYRYDSTCGMVQATIQSSTAPDSVTYDALCNPSAVKTPKGFWTMYRTDAIGRVVADSSPTGVKDSVVYDVMDRVTKTMKSGPARNGAPAQTATVTSAYDSAGRLTSVERTSSTSAVGTLTTSYRYDWAGRPVASVATDGAVESTVYDAAGNAISAITRLGGTSRPVTMKYDAMNRLVKRSVPSYVYASESIGLATKVSTERWVHKYPLYTNMPTSGDSGYTVPAQVDTMKYDAVGRILMANNGDAKISRSYYPGGLLKSDTTRVRTLADTASGAGGDFTHHVYGVGYGYDVAGRITTLAVPNQLAPRVQLDTLSSVLVISGVTQSIRDTIRYTYATGSDSTGWLSRVDGLLPGDVFSYGYVPRGEIATLHSVATAPDGPTALPIAESRTYDDDGALKTQFVSRKRGVATDTLRDATLTVDAEGRVVTLADTAKYNVSVAPTVVDYLYSGLGQLLSSDYETTSPDGFTNLSATETSSYDALGNWIARTNSASAAFAAPGGGSFTGTQASRAGRYTSNVGRLKGETLDATRTDTLVYDAAGNLHAMLRVDGGSPEQDQDRVSYYSVDGKLVAADARSVAYGGTALRGHTAFEEYRYDALGRRIWTRARRWCDDVTGATGGADAVACEISSVRRTVWDGNQELAEIEMPATDSTTSSTIENDTLPIVRSVPGSGDALYDANRLYGQVIYVDGLETDRPLAITRNHYADASSTSGSETYAVYAPFSIIPLWNSQGRADQAVVGGTAAPGEDYLCVDATTKTRCAEVFLDWGVFPYARSGAAMGSWNGTLLLDKPDATGTYYRRNRSYDPATARFTQEDPIGLAGGLNEYGFASGDPANYGDPFGLCCSSSDVATITSQLAQLAPQMNHEILWFLPKNIAAAATGLSAEAVLSRLASGARNLFGGGAEAVEEGVIYRRTNPKTGEGYIGRSKSEDAFVRRQVAHDSKLGVRHDYEIIGRGRNGTPLRVMEESEIRRGGGPGALANKRYEMNDEAYRAAGGSVRKP